jgi:hypothetical protein
VLRTIDGRDVHVNPAHVVSLTDRIEKQQNKALSDNVQCVVGLLDQKFISVAQSCEIVRRKLQGER